MDKELEVMVEFCTAVGADHKSHKHYGEIQNALKNAGPSKRKEANKKIKPDNFGMGNNGSSSDDDSLHDDGSIEMIASTTNNNLKWHVFNDTLWYSLGVLFLYKAIASGIDAVLIVVVERIKFGSDNISLFLWLAHTYFGNNESLRFMFFVINMRNTYWYITFHLSKDSANIIRSFHNNI